MNLTPPWKGLAAVVMITLGTLGFSTTMPEGLLNSISARGRGQTKGEAQKIQKTPNPQKPCVNETKIFVLDPGEVQDKIKELEANGYCIGKSNFLAVGSKVMLMVDQSDLYSEDEAEPECDGDCS